MLFFIDGKSCKRYNKNRKTLSFLSFRKDRDKMNMTELARLLLGLRSAGWTEKEINDFVLYIESGEEQYKPKPRNDK